jgi:hypothetical protein
VTRGNAAAARSLAPEGGEATATLLRAIVGNAEQLRVRDFGLRYVDEASAPSGEGAWSAAVEVTWRFDGFDRVEARAEVTFRFQPGDDGDIDVAEIGGGGLRTPVWMSGPVAVRRSADTLVLVAGPPGRADTYARLARKAVVEVRRVLPQWRTGLVVEVPEDSDALDTALDAEPGTYAGIAAVTSSTDGSAAPDSPIHVFANPDVYDRLRGVGAQVVMSHEAVHVATKAPHSTMPQWLLEGFADYVALRDVDLPLSVTAGQIIAQVRKNGAPVSLPAAGEFGSTDTHLGAAYESAWLACVVLADRAGEDELIALYAAVDESGDLAAELSRRFGWTERAFVAAWRQRLTDLAG